MHIRFIIIIVVGLVLMQPAAGFTAETTTEIYGTNTTSETITMAIYRERDKEASTQTVSISPNGGIEILYDYPTAWFWSYSSYYYDAILYRSSGSELCAVQFKIQNMYELWPTVTSVEMRGISGQCDASISRGLLLYGARVYIETK